MDEKKLNVCELLGEVAAGLQRQAEAMDRLSERQRVLEERLNKQQKALDRLRGVHGA